MELKSNVEKRLKQIFSSWFYTEPLLFSVACTHHLVQNDAMQIPMRTGKMRVEFSSKLLENCSDELLEQFYRIEMYRVLLKHPYERQPFNAQKKLLLLASDIVVYQLCNLTDDVTLAGIEYLKSLCPRFHDLEFPLGEKWAGTEEEKFFMRNLNINRSSGRLELIDNLSFEQWYKRLLFLVSVISVEGESVGEKNGSQNFSSDTESASELWEENPEALQEISEKIKHAETDEGWGGLGGNLSRKLKESEDFSFDYRRALTQFRQNIVAANRTLTRMRPSRRYGFKAMGSRYERKANVLIAVDVSGSITDESFEHFAHAIKNFFFLKIIEKIDLIFFDVNLKNTKPIEFRKKINLDEIKGRGGTNFQCAIDYFESHSTEYSGLIVFTDGEGDVPKVKGSGQILWILDSRHSFEKNRQWIGTLNGCKATYLPF